MVKKILNFDEGLKCLVCNREIEPQKLRCLKCGEFCKPVIPSDFYDKPEGTMEIIDIKSDCCNADIEIIGNITCGPKCHEDYVKDMENKMGKYQNVKGYKVPTRDIIEKGGLIQIDLDEYPLWD